MPADWGYGDDTQIGPIRGAALPMGFNRQPHYTRGLMLVGDAGGMVNPFNGEGIAYAMESGRLAADVAGPGPGRSTDAQRERALAAYPAVMKDALGGYYTLGRLFVQVIGQPAGDADRHPLRHAAADADALRPEADGQPGRAHAAATPWTGSSPV